MVSFALETPPDRLLTDVRYRFRAQGGPTFSIAAAPGSFRFRAAQGRLRPLDAYGEIQRQSAVAASA